MEPETADWTMLKATKIPSAEFEEPNRVATLSQMGLAAPLHGRLLRRPGTAR
jgi:phage replication-related protein YjqB (UPF0714/DUF867 family)